MFIADLVKKKNILYGNCHESYLIKAKETENINSDVTVNVFSFKRQCYWFLLFKIHNMQRLLNFMNLCISYDLL